MPKKSYLVEFPPTSANNLWLAGEFEQLIPFEVRVRIWEAPNYPPNQWRTVHFIGLLVKALHLAMGGDPSKGEDLVSVEPIVCLPIPNGVIHSTVVRTNWHDLSQAQKALVEGWPYFISDLHAIMGPMGEVYDEDNDVDLRTLRIEYGMGILLSGKPLIEVPPSRVLPMSATLKPGTLLKGNSNE